MINVLKIRFQENAHLCHSSTKKRPNEDEMNSAVMQVNESRHYFVCAMIKLSVYSRQHMKHVVNNRAAGLKWLPGRCQNKRMEEFKMDT